MLSYVAPMGHSGGWESEEDRHGSRSGKVIDR